MKLEEGMYVRTNDGYINKIKKLNQYNVLVDARDLFGEELNIPNNEIIKASYNIIDILEVGDYVNGNPVCIIKEDEHNRKWIYTDSNYKYGYLEEDIKSILTHEQIEQMAYKVEE